MHLLIILTEFQQIICCYDHEAAVEEQEIGYEYHKIQVYNIYFIKCT